MKAVYGQLLYCGSSLLWLKDGPVATDRDRLDMRHVVKSRQTVGLGHL
jgi:hypothetical protein